MSRSTPNVQQTEGGRRLSRRGFLAVSTSGVVALAAGCGPAATPPPTSAPKADATAAPQGTQAPVPQTTPAPTPKATQAPVAAGSAKPFAGTSINVAAFTAPYTQNLSAYIPNFEQQTGIKVSYQTPAFAVYNQQADMELSTKGSAYDAANITFIYSSRWIGAGWFTPLDDYLKDANKTPADWGATDWLPGGAKPFQDKKGLTYGFPFYTEPIIAGASRFDLIEKAGLKMPDTFDDMEKMCAAVNKKEDVYAYVNDNHFGWTWIGFLQGFGGNVFRNPPDDLMPTLDTPESIQAAEWFVNIIKKYTPDGMLSYNDDSAMNSLFQGRANYWTFNANNLVQVGNPQKSKTAKTVNYSLFPAGPKGRFPQVASHGFGIPVGSKKKDAAWEFIKWANSRELLQKMLVEKGYGGAPRRSVLSSPEYKKVMTANGVDVGDIYLKSLEMAGSGYMAYRTVHVYPQIDNQLNIAIARIASNQLSAKDSMKQAQTDSIAELKKGGINL